MKNKAHLDILETAADWCDRLDALSVDERRELNAWLQADPEHARAYDRMRRTMLDVALLDAAGDASPKRFDFSPGHFFAHAFASKATYGVLVGVAAAIALVILLHPHALTPALAPARTVVADTRDLATATGRTTEATLNDKSEIYLNADTSLHVAFSAKARAITLRRGEAIFQVSYDKSRPFTVHAGAAAVTAVGTRFGVERVGDGVEVRVYEGTVKVDAAGLSARPVTHGQWLLIDPKRGTSAGSFAAEQEADWRLGWLVADRMPLAYVVERLNRYSNDKIALADRRLADVDLTGRFRLDAPAATLTKIAALLDVSVEKNGREILLRKRDTN